MGRRGKMKGFQLTLSYIFERANQFFSKNEIVSRRPTGIFRYTYRDFNQRSKKLAGVLQSLGVERGDRVGTLAWNDHRHLEAYFAIPIMGAVLHTINFRLSPEHLTYIINHAEDKVLLVDETLYKILEPIAQDLRTVKAFIIMGEGEIPSTVLSPIYSYEQLIEDFSGEIVLPELDENEVAGMCFTSATTGNPKGVTYTHRGMFLHSMALSLTDSAAIAEKDNLMPVVPMFHANAWGLPFAATMMGTKQVMPGPLATPADLLKLITSERVTVTAGVPTVWLGVLKELEVNGANYDLTSLRAVICGGSAAPPSMIRTFEEKYKIPFIHAYGMTETGPLASTTWLKRGLEDLPYEEKLKYKAKQGIIVPGMEIKVVGKDGEAKWNGQEMGELLMRGAWVATEYYKDERSQDTFRDGWLHSGDVVIMDEEGYIQIVDRTKDLIKSGGEWISSVDLESSLMAHPAVFEAAVVAVAHPKWQERPLAVIVLKEQFNDQVTKEDFYEHLTKAGFAKWWLPDDILFVKELPKTGVGKILKRSLREQYQGFWLDKKLEG